MTYEPVDIYVENAAYPETPISDVLVRVYSLDGLVLYSEGATDTEGKVSFLLFAQEYTLRAHKAQVAFKQPQRFTVESAPGTPGSTPNLFTVKGTTLDHPLSPDLRFCRASGFFRTPTGAPNPNLGIQFLADFAPAILDGALVTGQRSSLRTDREGLGCIDLVRGACYSALIDGLTEDPQFIRQVRVPDLPYVNLPDLLFPIIARAAHPAITLVKGGTFTALPVVTDSSGITREGAALRDLTWSVGDTEIVSLSAGPEGLVLQGLQAGSTELSATRKDQSIVRVPDVGIIGLPIAITVTES